MMIPLNVCYMNIYLHFNIYVQMDTIVYYVAFWVQNVQCSWISKVEIRDTNHYTNWYQGTLNRGGYYEFKNTNGSFSLNIDVRITLNNTKISTKNEVITSFNHWEVFLFDTQFGCNSSTNMTVLRPTLQPTYFPSISPSKTIFNTSTEIPSFNDNTNSKTFSLKLTILLIIISSLFVCVSLVIIVVCILWRKNIKLKQELSEPVPGSGMINSHNVLSISSKPSTETTNQHVNTAIIDQTEGDAFKIHNNTDEMIHDTLFTTQTPMDEFTAGNV